MRVTIGDGRGAGRSRSSLATLSVVCLLGLVLTGCSTEDGGSTSESEAGAGETRTVTDSEGTDVELPMHPERPVTLHFAATEALLDLGVAPVLQGNSGDLSTLLPAAEYEQVKDVPQVELGDLKVEQVAEADPDVILAPNMAEPEVIDQLRDVAPVYVYTHAGKDRADWQGRGDQIADAMNLTDELDDVKSRLADRQREIADSYRETLEGVDAALFAAWKGNELGIVGPDSMPGRILSPAGLTWDATTAELTEDVDGQELSISTEKVTATLSDADVVFYGTDLFGDPAPETAEVLAMEAYKDLPAVKSGRSFPIGKETIAGYIDAFNVLDFLEAALKTLEE